MAFNPIIQAKVIYNFHALLSLFNQLQKWRLLIAY